MGHMFIWSHVPTCGGENHNFDTEGATVADTTVIVSCSVIHSFLKKGGGQIMSGRCPTSDFYVSISHYLHPNPWVFNTFRTFLSIVTSHFTTFVTVPVVQILEHSFTSTLPMLHC